MTTTQNIYTMGKPQLVAGAELLEEQAAGIEAMLGDNTTDEWSQGYTYAITRSVKMLRTKATRMREIARI